MTQPFVFICYSHADEEEKDRLLSHLGVSQRAEMLDLWSDDRIGVGAAWEEEIEEAMAQATVAILLVSANFLTSDFILDKEVPTLLQRRKEKGLTIFPVIAKHCAWRAIDWLAKMQVRPKEGQPVWREGGRHADEELAAIATEIAGIFGYSISDQEEAPAPGESPFKGLQYFDETDAELFFGREQVTAKLVGHLRKHRFLAVVGASGSGKSSIVRAGLIPALKRGEPLADEILPPDGSPGWPIHVITPTAHPLKELAASLTRDSLSVDATRVLMDDLAKNPRNLDLAIHRILSQSPARRLLLVVDQFEELFTLCRSQAERKTFVDNLLTAALKRSGPTMVVITLRADFYAHCAQFDRLREMLAKRQEYIGPMTTDELGRAIEEPARRGGWEFEPGLVELLLRDVGDEPGALPLLSHALLETWKHRRGHTLTFKSYAESGGVHRAIAQTAEAVFHHRLTGEQQTIARDIFLRLTELGEGTQGTRRRAVKTELLPHPEAITDVEAVLKILADARLITTAQETVEVAHEALIREWPLLREWLDENREALRTHRRLTEAAEEWARNDRDSSYLYRGARLAGAAEWADQAKVLNEQERAFLEAGLAEQRRQAEAQRAEEQAQATASLRQRAVWLAGVGVVAVFLAVAAGVFGVQSETRRIEADDARLTAVWNEQRAGNEAAVAVNARQTAVANEKLAIVNEQRAENGAGAAVNARQTAVANEKLAIVNEQRAENGAAAAVSAHKTAEAERATAERLQTEAEHQSRIILAQSLAALAPRIVDRRNDTELATLLALEALYLNRSVGGNVQELIDSSLREILSEPYFRRVLSDHEGRVWSVAFSPDGRSLASDSFDGTVRLWDLENPSADPVVLSGHEDDVLSVVFSPDGRSLASGSFDGTVRLWDLENPSTAPIVLSGHEDSVGSVVFSSDGRSLASGSWDDTIRLWDLADPSADPIVLSGHEDDIWSVTFSPDGRSLASGSWDNTVRLWDLADPSADPIVLSGHEDRVSSVVFSPDGSSLASASFDQTVRLWDLGGPSTDPIVLSGHKLGVLSVAFSSDGRSLASAGEDRTVRLWNLADPSADPIVLSGHASLGLSVTFSPDGRSLASGSFDGTVRLWELAGPSAAPVVLSHKDFVSSIAFSPNGRSLASGSDDDTVRVWDLADPSAAPIVLSGHENSVNSVVFSPDGRSLASGSDDDTVRLWDLADASADPIVLSGHEDSVRSVVFSPDGHSLASRSNDRTVRLWDLEDPSADPVILSYNADVLSVVFSPDGRNLASGSNNRTVHVWDLADPSAAPIVLSGHENSINSVVFSSDGRSLASASEDRTVRVWDLADPSAAPIVLSGHEDDVWSVVFSPDGRSLASGSGDGTVRLWDLADPSTGPIVFSGHEDSVRSVVFSPDGRSLASGSDDWTVRLWDLENPSADPIVLSGHEDRIWSVVFSPDGRSLASRSSDRTVRLWPTFDRLVELACQQVRRNLTQAEWDRYLPNEAYRKTCPNLPIHPSFIEVGRELARAGNIEAAIAHFEQVRALEPALDLDPRAEAQRLAAQALVEQGRELAGRGDVEGAIEQFQAALALDPALDLDEIQAEMRQLTAQLLVEQGRELAGQGDVEGALEQFQAALELDPTLDLDPQVEAAQALIWRGRALVIWQDDIEGALEQFQAALALDPTLDLDLRTEVAQALVWRSTVLASEGKIQEALVTLEEAQRLDPTLEIPVEAWTLLCVYGGYWGYGAEVIDACERSLSAEEIPGDLAGFVHFGRGLVRASMEDYSGAAEDLEFFVELVKENNVFLEEELGFELETWIAELKADRNPFDEATLKKLRQNLFGP